MKVPIRCLVAISCAAVASGCGANGPPPGAGPAFPDRRVAFVGTPGHALGYVANRYSDTVTVLDLTSMTVLGEAPVGLNPVQLDGPRRMAVDRARGVGYVVFTYPESVVGAHAVAHGARPPFGYVRELSLRDLAPLGDVAMDRQAFSLSLSPDGGLLAVVHFDEELAMLPSDLETRRASLILVASPDQIASGLAAKRKGPVCVSPLDVVLGPDGTRAFVACAGEDQLAVVDTSSLAVLARVPAGDGPANHPTALVLDPAGSRVLVSDELTRRIVAFQADDSAAQLGATGELPGIPGPVAFLSSGEWLVPLRAPDGAARLDPASGAIVGYTTYTDEQCRTPSTATVSATAGAFLVCEGDHEGPGALVRLDPLTLEAQARLPLGRFPDALAVVEPAAGP
jgi:YVTN family beta-propeller protein